MKSLTKSTKSVKEKEIKREWHLIDVKDKVLGREVTKISTLLQGKHKVNYVPYLDCGDNVVVINASKVILTGNKEQTKEHLRYSGYPGGLKRVTIKELRKEKPEEIVRHAVLGMLPKNKLRARRIARLFIYPNENHPYESKLKVKSE